MITAQVGGPDLGKPSSHRDVGAMSPGRHHGSSDFLLSLTVKVSRCLEGPSPQEAPYKGAQEETSGVDHMLDAVRKCEDKQGPEGLAGSVS